MHQLKLFICASLIASSAISFSQVNNFALGPEGGPGISILWPKSNNSFYVLRKPAIGGLAAYAFQYNFNNTIALKTSLSYERKGSDFELQNAFGTNYIDHARYDYLTLPILVKATFGDKIKFFLDAGPYFSVLLRQLFVVENPIPGKQVISNTDNDKLFDTGIAAGAGILYFFAGQYGVSFEARNDLGLYNTSKVATANNVPVRTNATNFIFGFEYKLVTRKAPKKQKAG